MDSFSRGVRKLKPLGKDEAASLCIAVSLSILSISVLFSIDVWIRSWTHISNSDHIPGIQ